MRKRNLNPWWALLMRRLDQWAKRTLYKFCRKHGAWLDEEIRQLSLVEGRLTDTQRSRMEELHWLRGTGSIYRLTTEEKAKQAEMAKEVMDRLFAERKAQS